MEIKNNLIECRQDFFKNRQKRFNEISELIQSQRDKLVPRTEFNPSIEDLRKTKNLITELENRTWDETFKTQNIKNAITAEKRFPLKEMTNVLNRKIVVDNQKTENYKSPEKSNLSPKIDLSPIKTVSNDKIDFSFQLETIQKEYDLVKDFIDNVPKNITEYFNLEKKLRLLKSKQKTIEFRSKYSQKIVNNQIDLTKNDYSQKNIKNGLKSSNEITIFSNKNDKNNIYTNYDYKNNGRDDEDIENKNCDNIKNRFDINCEDNFYDFTMEQQFGNEKNCSNADKNTNWQSKEFEWTEEIQNLLQNFGLTKFRKNQREIINASLSGNDVFVLMPTGGGKSLCYQLSALVHKGTTVVVSPLISLIHDQVSALIARDIKVSAFSSGCETDPQIWQELRDCSVKLLYVTPEKLVSSQAIRNTLKKARFCPRFVIDEAHCVSTWGHDFRPDYMSLSFIKEEFPSSPVMALTATATDIVRAEIIKNLKLSKNVATFQQSFNRPNLRYSVLPKSNNATKQLAALLSARHAMQSGIVYCHSRRETETVALALRTAGIPARHYHAGLTAEQRSAAQDDWSNDRCQVIAATVAFGMGIDKPDVRFVVHFTLPKSPESYYQEAGRAGRDGDAAECVVLYSYRDKRRVEFVLRQNANSSKAARDVETLYKMVQFCENDADCRRSQLLDYFGEAFDGAECGGTCDNCGGDFGATAAKAAKAVTEKRDVAPLLRQLLERARELSARGNLKSGVLLAAFRGSLGRSEVSVNEARRLLHLALQRGLLEETVETNSFGGFNSKLFLGPRRVVGSVLMSFKVKTKSPPRKRKAPKKTKRPPKPKKDEKQITKKPIPKPKNSSNSQCQNLKFAKGMTEKSVIGLFEELEETRSRIQKESICSTLPKGMNIRAIMPTEALMVFAAELPSSEVAMSTVNQVGYSRFRSRFLAVIKNFAFQYNLKLNENTISRKCPLSLKRLLLPHSCSVIRDLS